MMESFTLGEAELQCTLTKLGGWEHVKLCISKGNPYLVNFEFTLDEDDCKQLIILLQKAMRELEIS